MHISKRRSYINFGLIILFIATNSLTSCLSVKKVVYFGDLKEDTLYPNPVTINATPFVEPRIESNDVLAITVQTLAHIDGNSPITTNTTGSFNALNGFLVDKNGYIELSLIGFVKVGGLTTSEARELIKQKAKEYYREPVVNVRIANFDIYFLGDMNKATTLNVPNEKINIIDALAQAGDVTISANKKNVLLIRSEGDQKKFVRFDLTKSDVFHSPYFYLKQRDILYVEPSRYKIQSSDNSITRWLGIISSVVSIASLLLVFKVVK